MLKSCIDAAEMDEAQNNYKLVQFIIAASIFFPITKKFVSSNSCILSFWHHSSLELKIYYILSTMLNLQQDLFC